MCQKHQQRRVISHWHRLVDLLEDHPFELMLSLALTLFGIRAFISGLSTIPASLSALPIVLTIGYCVLSVAGGGFVIFGVTFRYKYGWAYGVERAGLFISAAAWGSYIVGYILLQPMTGTSTLFILALLALSSACLLRARAINRNARATLIALRHAKEDQEEQNE